MRTWFTTGVLITALALAGCATQPEAEPVPTGARNSVLNDLVLMAFEHYPPTQIAFSLQGEETADLEPLLRKLGYALFGEPRSGVLPVRVHTQPLRGERWLLRADLGGTVYARLYDRVPGEERWIAISPWHRGERDNDD